MYKKYRTLNKKKQKQIFIWQGRHQEFEGAEQLSSLSGRKAGDMF
jgi:hypothetical protein